MRYSILRPALITAALAAVALAVNAPSASAHGSGQSIPDAKHYLTQIDGVTPTVAGLMAKVDPRGEWVEVTNATGNNLTIFGYAHEPYLQITPAGLAENVRSVSGQLNRSLFGDLSQIQLAQAPPVWQTRSTSNTARWHDHRIHWMSAQRPPDVQAHPGRQQLIGRWTVHMQLDTQPIDLNGTLSWLPIKQTSLLAKLTIGIDIALLAVAIGGLTFWQLGRSRRARNRTHDIAGPGSSDPPSGPAAPPGWTSADRVDSDAL
jgi:hypothetical protein